MVDYFIGIDGGGTSCRAALADGNGTILGRGKSGASNILTDPDTALKHIAEAARLAFEEAGITPDLPSAPAVLGLAGNNVGDAVNYVQARLPFKQSEIVSDGVIALQGAIGDEDGAIGIVGTGTVYIARHDGELHSIAGWGFQVSDLGSGARLGQLALQESLLAYDAIRPMTGLSKAILAEFGNNPENVVDFARLAKPGDYGRYTPKVFEFARQGDEAAIRILKTGADGINEALDAVNAITRGKGRLCLLGGLAPLYPEYLAERHRSRLSEPLADALTGAVALAVKAYGSPSEARA
ncbi:N-acetylglucosamine kinase [Neorhizobium petrolearium]|uniref:N-acetylglucosamine kinase n=1 Tax=Neorhizobium petrolearium TaxID=515361 RepID=A0ABY8M185_9HYPH|nr:N-acetylglucosamine kinase [Neorhizobium petrolearium]MCC2613156.1 N-acetylglucosamine kinase [Neorhizobium petrolearium]WGI68249.1 N-acetylglucosamine kinase [Neorhizobium petrolearium]